MTELQTVLEWIGTGMVGLLIIIVILMLVQLFRRGNRNDWD